MMVTGASGNSMNFRQMQNINSGNQDSSLKGIQDQIQNVQKQLQTLSNNEKISGEEKVSMKQAKTVQSVKTRLEGRTSVLESEIKTDGGRGSTEKKEEELARLNGRIKDASSHMMKRASDVKRTLEKSGVDQAQKNGKSEENSEAAEDSETSRAKAQGDMVYLQPAEEELKGQYIDIRL